MIMLSSISMPNTNYHYYRRVSKFCNGCGRFGRADNLKENHHKVCPKGTEGGKTSFLKIG